MVVSSEGKNKNVPVFEAIKRVRPLPIEPDYKTLEESFVDDNEETLSS